MGLSIPRREFKSLRRHHSTSSWQATRQARDKLFVAGGENHEVHDLRMRPSDSMWPLPRWAMHSVRSNAQVTRTGAVSVARVLTGTGPRDRTLRRPPPPTSFLSIQTFVAGKDFFICLSVIPQKRESSYKQISRVSCCGSSLCSLSRKTREKLFKRFSPPYQFCLYFLYC